MKSEKDIKFAKTYDFKTGPFLDKIISKKRSFKLKNNYFRKLMKYINSVYNIDQQTKKLVSQFG